VLYPDEKNYQKVERVLTGVNPATTRLVVIAPGSVWYTKRWPLERYALLTERLVVNGYTVFLSGSGDEKGINEYILHRVLKKYPDKSGFIHCTAGKFDLLDTAALISKVGLVICNDSGTLHIANAMKTPVFAFFGPTVKDIGYFPFGEQDHVFEVDVPCRPCGSHGGRKCSKGHFDCMMKIEVDTVLDRVFSGRKTDNR
jgi:heptosyltransferase-2